MESEIGEFDFKPLNEGLGFHRKVKPLEAEADSEDSFSFSAIGAGTLDVTSREQSKGLLTSSTLNTSSSTPSFGLNGGLAGSTASTTGSGGKAKHNTKSVSDLIAALPPSLDLLLEEPSTGVASTPSASANPVTAGKSGRKRAPLFGPPSDELVKPGAPAAASLSQAAAQQAASTEKPKKGFLNLPLGRNDYGLKAKAGAAAPAVDENLAKTFPSVFPHLGSLAGQPAAATLKAPMAGQTTQVSTNTSTSVDLHAEVGEQPIAAHFGSAVLDTLVAIGIACLFLAVALSITGANLLAMLESSQTDEAIIVSLAMFFVGMGLLYVLAARTWVGATLGEWSYEVRVGDAHARKRWFYPILILWRGLVVAATGFVVLPLVSILVGRDVLKYLTGLELTSVEGTPEPSPDMISRSTSGARVNHASENPA